MAANDRIGPLRTSMNDATDNDRNVDAAVLTEDRKTTGTIYVVLDVSFSRGMKIEVTEGDNVLSIKDKLMERKKNFFASVNAYDSILCESEGTTESEAESTSDTVEIPLNPVCYAPKCVGG